MTHNPNVQAPGLQEPAAPRASASSTGASPEEKSVFQNDRYNHLQRRGRHSAAATMDEALDLNVCLASAVQKAAVNIQKELGGPPPSVIPTVQIQRVGPGVLTSRASCGRVRRLVKKDKILPYYETDFMTAVHVTMRRGHSDDEREQRAAVLFACSSYPTRRAAQAGSCCNCSTTSSYARRRSTRSRPRTRGSAISPSPTCAGGADGLPRVPFSLLPGPAQCRARSQPTSTRVVRNQHATAQGTRDGSGNAPVSMLMGGLSRWGRLAGEEWASHTSGGAMRLWECRRGPHATMLLAHNIRFSESQGGAR